MRRSSLQNAALGTVGTVLFLVAWEIVGAMKLAGLTWPRLSDVLRYLADPSHAGLLARALGATLGAVAHGYFAGMTGGMALASFSQMLPPLKPGADRLVALIHAIPAIALAPLFMVLLDREATPAAMAAIGVFFVTYVATSAAFEDMTAAHRDLFSVLGASRVRRFVLLGMPAAIPAAVTGAKVAVPAALIGVVLGEWFGASRGLGVLMVSAMQNFQIVLLWAAVLLCALVSLLLFRVGAVMERIAFARFR